MAIAYTARAQADLLSMVRYGQQSWPGTARTYVANLRGRIENVLLSHPGAGKPATSGTRKLVLAGTPYVAYYKLPASPASPDIVIVRVLHGRQQQP